MENRKRHLLRPRQGPRQPVPAPLPRGTREGTADRGQLVFHGTTARLAEPTAFRDTIREARGKGWVVYAKLPFRGPQQVFRYLSRYTHRFAISNSRILKPSTAAPSSSGVASPGTPTRPRYGTITVSAEEFIRRFLLHVVPDGMHRIRHFGILANACRAKNLDIARKTMDVPAADGREERHDTLPGIAPVPCPHCGATMFIAGILTAARSRHASRGPPETP